MIQIRFIESMKSGEKSLGEMDEPEYPNEDIQSTKPEGQEEGPRWQFKLITPFQDEELLLETGAFWHRTSSYQPVLPIEEVAIQIHERLEVLEQQFAKEAKSYRVLASFEDARQMSSQRASGFIDVKGLCPEPTENLWAACALYKGIYKYLTANGRFQSLSAWLTRLYVAWQWFNILKLLYIKLLIRPNLRNLVRDEFSQSYKALSELLADPRFSFAAQFLGNWLRTPPESYPVMREKLRLSMILSERDNDDEITVHTPIEAPGCHRKNESKIVWDRMQLYLKFIDGQSSEVRWWQFWKKLKEIRQGRATIIRLIRDWLLPRYDLATPLRLAELIKRERTSSIWPIVKFFIPLLLFAIVIVFLPRVLGFLGNYFPVLAGMSQNAWPLWICLVPILSLYARWFDLGLLAYLALPRLLGGIGVGYFVLVVEQNNIAQAIWGPCPNITRAYPFYLLTGLAVVASFTYFYVDVQRIGIDRWEAMKRAGLVLALAIFLTLGAGLAAVALSTAAYAQETTWFFIGPFGKVDFAQYLTFAPLALLAGMTLQLIWQDRTPTSTVGVTEEF